MNKSDDISLQEAFEYYFWPKYKIEREAKSQLLAMLRDGRLTARAGELVFLTGPKEGTLVAENVDLSKDFWIRPWTNWSTGLVIRMGPRRDEYDGSEFDRGQQYFARGVRLTRCEVGRVVGPNSSKESGSASLGTATTSASQRLTAPMRPRGPRPAQRERVTVEMQTLSPEELARMKEEEMAARFGASRDVCRQARDRVLSGFRGEKLRQTPTIDN